MQKHFIDKKKKKKKKKKKHRGGVSAERTHVHTAKSAKMESQEPNRPTIPLSGYRYCPHCEQMVSNRTDRSHCMQRHGLDSTKNADAIGVRPVPVVNYISLASY